MFEPENDIATNSRGLSLVMTPEQTDQYIAEQDAQYEPEPPFISGLAGHIDGAWAANKAAKQPIEEILLQCARQRDGEYDPEVLAQLQEQGEDNPVFTMITDIKCRTAVAWIKDAMLPSGEIPFSVDPSPIPELPPEMIGIAKAKIAARLQEQLAAQGMAVEQVSQEMMVSVAKEVKEELKQEIKDLANDVRERMKGLLPGKLFPTAPVDWTPDLNALKAPAKATER
jgi:hypothetical protein